MKRNWGKLKEDKCPVFNCKTNGVKTKLEKDYLVLRCPKCKGEWKLECYAPMDISWIELKKPERNVND